MGYENQYARRMPAPQVRDDAGEGLNVRDARFAGGAAGNGEADDTPAFLAVAAAAGANDCIIVPTGTYRLTAAWVIGKAVTIYGPGATFLVDHPGNGLVFQPFGSLAFGREEDERLNLDLGTIVRRENIGAQNADATGLMIVNSYHGFVRVNRIRGFQTGLRLHGTDVGREAGGGDAGGRGCIHNDVFLGYGENWKNVCLTTAHGGWCAANRFFGGHFASQSGAPGDPAQRTHILLDNGGEGSRGVSSNSFYGFSLEGYAMIGVQLRGGAARNVFHDVYSEMHAPAVVIDNAGGGYDNVFHDKRGLIEALKVPGKILDTPGTRLRIVGSDIHLGQVEYYNGHVYIRNDLTGAPKPRVDWTPTDGDGVGLAMHSRPYRGSPLSFSMQSSRRVEVVVQAALPAGAVRLANEPTSPRLTPRTSYLVEVTFRAGGTSHAIDPQFISGYTISYAHHPRPRVPANGSQTYRLRITLPYMDPRTKRTAPGSVEVLSVSGSMARAAVAAITAAPEYVGQIAVVGGVGYLAVGVASAADWKRIT